MDAFLTHIYIGFAAVLAPEKITLFGMMVSIPVNIFYALFGAFIGTMVGVLPGIGPFATLAMLLPVTYGMQPLGGLIMLAGIYYGCQYGGSTTSILVNIPGETSSVMTCLDGYQMALRGRAGVALTTAAVGSFFAGCIGVLLLAAFSEPLANIALKFGPEDYFSVMVLGLVSATVLATGSLLKAIAMVCIGLLLGLVGTDVSSGVSRYTFGISELLDGIGIVTVALGLFSFAEVLRNLDQGGIKKRTSTKVTSLFPTKEDWKRMIMPFFRGTALGSALGILPGSGPAVATFGAYALEKKVCKNRAEFGKGAIEGVASPEAANNAFAQTSFVPLLSLGIPASPVMAMMLAAMMIHDIQPGPQVMITNPSLFWGLIVSMWIGNLMLLVLNLPLIGIWVQLLKVPYRFLYPAILTFCCIGVYSVNNSTFDVLMTALFGFTGYVFYKLDCEPAPLLLGIVLGPLMEENFSRALIMSRGSFAIFYKSPVSAALLLISAVALLIVAVLPSIMSKRNEVCRMG